MMLIAIESVTICVEPCLMNALKFIIHLVALCAQRDSQQNDEVIIEQTP